MDWDEVADGFAAMGSGARLKVLRQLVRAGDGGLSVGEIRSRTGIAASTLAHHLKMLTDAGIVVQHKVGRSIISRANYAKLGALADFILSECCADENKGDVRDG